MPRLLSPGRFTPRTPAVRVGFIVIHPGLVQIDELLGRSSGQLLTQLCSQRFVPLGIAEGLFLCV